jgi:hypothetical protein
MKIELTKQQLNNLKIFLNRVRLEGDLAQQLMEAEAIKELIIILNKQNGNK